MPFYPGAGAYRGKMKGVLLLEDFVQGRIEKGEVSYAKGVIERGGAKRVSSRF